jgi:hypothetical protein
MGDETFVISSFSWSKNSGESRAKACVRDEKSVKMYDSLSLSDNSQFNEQFWRSTIDSIRR